MEAQGNAVSRGIEQGEEICPLAANMKLRDDRDITSDSSVDSCEDNEDNVPDVMPLGNTGNIETAIGIDWLFVEPDGITSQDGIQENDESYERLMENHIGHNNSDAILTTCISGDPEEPDMNQISSEAKELNKDLLSSGLDESVETEKQELNHQNTRNEQWQEDAFGMQSFVDLFNNDLQLNSRLERCRPQSNPPCAALEENLKQIGRLVHPDGVQYIKRKATGDSENGILLYSGKFRSGEVELKLHSESCLLTSKNHYVARVAIQQVDEVDNATSFREAKVALLKHLKIVQVLLDEQLQESKVAHDNFRAVLHEMSNGTIDHFQHAEDLFQLWQILHGKDRNRNLSEVINQNPYISMRMKTAINQHIDKDSKLNARNNFFSTFSSFFRKSESNRWIDIIRKAIIGGMANHRSQLLSKCPSIMKKELTKLHDRYILFVTARDLKLFSDISNALDMNVFESILPILASRFLKKVTELKENKLHDVIPVTNQIYYFLCKSLLEVADEVKSKANIEKLLQYDENEWKIADLSGWTSKSTLDSCLRQQLELLKSLVNHFEPGKYTLNSHFQYKLKLFHNAEASPEWQKVIQQLHQAFPNDWNRKPSSENLPTELHVWICLLDDTIAHVFSNDYSHMQMFLCMFKFYTTFILSGDFNRDSLESLRVITHNILRYIAQTGPFIRKQNNIDGEIVQKQVHFMNSALFDNRMAFNEYRDLIEVFTAYWKQRSDFMVNFPTKLPGDYLGKEAEEIQMLLLQSMSKALDKKIRSTDLIKFCRAYEELLADLTDLQFEWYVRLPQTEQNEVFILSKVLELVDNRWKDSANKCYRVINQKKFVQLFLVLYDDEELPTHYLVSAVKIFLKYINGLAEKKQWNADSVLSERAQVCAMILLIGAIRSSLLYLKEQPDYICFDRFLEESIKPFCTVIEESVSFNDFQKRVLLIKESFWYIRNMNTIDIDTALTLYEPINSFFDDQHLRSAYSRYSDQFEKYMSNTGSSCEAKIKRIVADVYTKVNAMLTTEWTFEFKQNTLPIILAGLGAVWSLQVSKDVASTGQYLKPHCIQTLCVLRLLSADNTDLGVKKHLAQVLTGQGKSLVLALIAAVLAMFGHNVQIVCYSEYLAQRDEQDFDELYEYFSVDTKISYDTFEEMASKQVEASIKQAQHYLKHCLGLSLNKKLKVHNFSNPEKSVLLIDEVDVFFTDKFYGNTYNPAAFQVVPGLGLIQQKIWELVTQGHWDPRFIQRKIKEFEDYSTHPDLQQFKSFINRPQTYLILEAEGNELIEKFYTNKELYLQHLRQMITTAMTVHQQSDNDYQLSEHGLITVRNKFGKYDLSTYYGYCNTFNYFKLKRCDFVQRISNVNNYGYLLLKIGSISYSKLPENYPLILGVTGTLTTLDEHEKRAVEGHYQIRQSSVMPSFFGYCNLQFDKKNDFICLSSITEWMNHIFFKINSIVNNKRAVLVFFETQDKISAFAQEFGSQFDRLNILTPNTDEDLADSYINDAGVAKTVTLVVREMGRGVDYKSSVSVEKNGGIHVIQTFFSLDIKEETQIKGRTARKDNRGSYELVVCLTDLEDLELVQSSATASRTNYDILNKARSQLSLKAGTERTTNVELSDAKHCKTVDFYRSIYSPK